MATLNVTTGPAAGRTVLVDRDMVIGREAADVTIPDPEISRRHARIRPVEGGVVVEDLGSLNGTFVNGVRVGGAVTLTSGATIRVGRSEIAVDVSVAAAPPPAPVAPPAAAPPPARPRGTVRRIE